MTFARIVLLTLLLAACAPVAAPRLFTIDAPAEIDQAKCRAAATSLAVATVHLPEYADRSQIVFRAQSHEVTVDDGFRWAERPATAVTRMMARTLGARLARCVRPEPAADAADELRMTFDSFEIGADQAPLLAGRWQLLRQADLSPRASGEFNVHGAAATSIEGQVASLNDGLAELAVI